MRRPEALEAASGATVEFTCLVSDFKSFFLPIFVPSRGTRRTIPFLGAVHLITTFQSDLITRNDSRNHGETRNLDQADGDPTPTILWRKDGQTLRDTFRSTVDGGRLHLRNVTKADEGSYECTALNDAGVVVARARITVQGPPSNLFLRLFFGCTEFCCALLSFYTVFFYLVLLGLTLF